MHVCDIECVHACARERVRVLRHRTVLAHASIIVLALDELLICNPLFHDGLDFSFEASKNVFVSFLVLLVADPIPNLCSGHATIQSVHECWHQGRLDEGEGITNKRTT